MEREMKVEEFLKMADKLFSESKGLLRTKNEDYSKGEPFRNFERQAALCKILELDISKREHWALAQILEKVNRLRELEDRDPKHESIRGTCADGINFFILYYGMRKEEKK